MTLADSIARLDALGPIEPPTADQIAAVRARVAGQPDAADLLAMILGGAA